MLVFGGMRLTGAEYLLARQDEQRKRVCGGDEFHYLCIFAVGREEHGRDAIESCGSIG